MVFAGCFLFLWYSDREKRYVLWIAIAILLFFLGSLSQIFGLPSSVGANALISAALYLASVILTCKALIERSSSSAPQRLFAILFCSVLTGIAYYFYVERNLIARIYVLNFGIGVVFAITVFRLKYLRTAGLPDRVLFWAIAAFTMQFFIRTGLTAEKLQNASHDYGFSVFWSALQLSVAIFGVAIALALLAVIVNDNITKIDGERTTDFLSQLLNRRGFEETISRLPENLAGAVGAMLLIDIDHFKHINDNFGHVIGDAVIKHVAKRIHETTAPRNGFACRLGGEEFAVLLAAISEQEAASLAENIRAAIGENHITAQGRDIAVTVSIGVYPYTEIRSLEALLKYADEALYIAKRSGRNRIAVLEKSPMLL